MVSESGVFKMAKQKMNPLEKMLSGIRKYTDSETFETSKFGEINDYISTGSYAVNRIMTGSLFNGVPQGRVVTLGGESGVGKSLLCAFLIKSALDDGYDHIFYFDSEGGALKKFFENVGCDLTRIEHIVLHTVDDAKVKIMKMYDDIDALKNSKKSKKKASNRINSKDNINEVDEVDTSVKKDYKFLMILDSLGNLNTSKSIDDAVKKSKNPMDMGIKARLLNDMMSAITIPAMKTDTGFISVNHVYDNPADMFKSKIKSQSGGKKSQYVGTIGLQITKTLEKSEEKGDEQFYGGSWLNFFTTKNRLVQPFLSTEIYVDFSHGIRKWDGLLEPALEYGLVVREGNKYNAPSYDDKKYFLSELIDKDDWWKSFLNELDECSQKDLQYSSVNDDSDVDEIINELEDDVEIVEDVNGK